MDDKNIKLLSLFKRFFTEEEVWKDLAFGTDQNKLYIDSCIVYKDEEEKKLLQEWLTEEESKHE